MHASGGGRRVLERRQLNGAIDMRATLPAVPLGFDVFLAWEERQPERFELVGGVVRLMAGGTEGHDRIAREHRGRAAESGSRLALLGASVEPQGGEPCRGCRDVPRRLRALRPARRPADVGGRSGGGGRGPLRGHAQARPDPQAAGLRGHAQPAPDRLRLDRRGAPRHAGTRRRRRLGRRQWPRGWRAPRRCRRSG